MITCTIEEAVQIAKEATWLAYQAAQVIGMGFLQAKDDATFEEVTEGMGLHNMTSDYIFGRMMKLRHFGYKDGVFYWQEDKLRPDYQSWCYKYPTITSLIHQCPTYMKLRK